MRRLAAALTAGLLLALVPACGSDGGEDDGAALSGAPSGPASTAEPPSLVGPATTTTVAPAVVDPRVPGAAPPSATTTAAPAPSPAAPAPRSASPVPPPPAGTYRYDTTGQSSYPGLGGGSSPYPAVTTLVVDPPAGTHQHAVRNLRDTSGNGGVVDTRFDYRNDGVYLESLGVTLTVLLFSDTLEFRPPFPTLLLPTGAKPGYSQELNLPGRVAPARLVVEVLREEQVRVGGRDVATTVVRLNATTTGQFSAGMELTIWLAPASGVWVKERSASEAKAPDGTLLYQAQYEATLQRLP